MPLLIKPYRTSTTSQLFDRPPLTTHHSRATTMTTFQKNIYDGKVLFITGGRTGIGYRIVEEMMRHGANAIIVGRE